VNVRLVVLGESPPGLAESVARGLPWPYAQGVVEPAGRPEDGSYDRHRAQYDASRLVASLEPPPPGWTALGVTGLDLFLPPLAYVFGVSELAGRRGVVSWARLRPEIEEPLPSAHLLRRLTVEAVHELGHSIGLLHCVVPECAMHRSLFAEAVDLKHPEYCPACVDTLRASLGR
jgi:archaemetzincin